MKSTPLSSMPGIKMNRVLLVTMFLGFGLFATWSTLRLLALIDWRSISFARSANCWEIDHCNVSWYFLVLYISMLLAPTATHAFFGWQLGRVNASLRKVATAIFVLWVATLAFYVTGRIVSGY